MDDDVFEGLLDELEAVEGDQPLDEIFELLADQHVRYTLYFLSERSTTSLDQLADVVAGLEAMETDAITTPGDHEQIRARLYHVVLPKLDDSGYVRFDPGDGTIALDSVPPIVFELLNTDG